MFIFFSETLYEEQNNIDEESENKSNSIYRVFPNEIMYLFLERMDLESLGKTVSTDKLMAKSYLEAFRKRFWLFLCNFGKMFFISVSNLISDLLAQ